MDFKQITLAVRARRKAFLVVLGATIFTALAIALIVPKNYVSSATIMIDARSEQAMSGAERLSPRERTGYLQTQVDLIQSGRVPKRVGHDAKHAQAPRM